MSSRHCRENYGLESESSRQESNEKRFPKPDECLQGFDGSVQWAKEIPPDFVNGSTDPSKLSSHHINRGNRESSKPGRSSQPCEREDRPERCWTSSSDEEGDYGVNEEGYNSRLDSVAAPRREPLAPFPPQDSSTGANQHPSLTGSEPIYGDDQFSKRTLIHYDPQTESQREKCKYHLVWNPCDVRPITPCRGYYREGDRQTIEPLCTTVSDCSCECIDSDLTVCDGRSICPRNGQKGPSIVFEW